MPNGEPIGVAFVEVRPEVEDFQVNAEQDIRAGIGDDALKVQSEFELTGVDAARSDLAALTDEASRAMRELAEQTSPDFAQGFVAGAQEAVASAIELGDVTEQANASVITGTEARRAFSAANTAAAVSERQLATETRQQTRAVYQADAAERDLFRTRARRAASLGPLRLAGVGLGAGTALFAGAQALRELGAALKTTGEESQTFEGRARNLGAALLGGDIVGAFRALTSRTQEFSTAELVAINRTEGLIEVIRRLGGEADVAAAQAASLPTLTQVPQFLQTRIAQTELTGDTGGQLQALEQAQEELIAQEKTVRQLGLDQQQLNIALEAIFRERKNLGDQIADLTNEAGPDILAPLVEAVTDARLSGDAGRIITALQRERATLERVIAAERTSADDRRRFKDALVGVNRDIEATQAELIGEMNRHAEASRQGFLAPVVTSALEAEVRGDVQGQIRSLQAEALMIKALLVALKATDTDASNTYEEYLARLKAVNGQIESLQDGITAEAERHANEAQNKLDEADQAFLRSFDNRLHKANMAQTLAAASAGLADNIAASNRLQGIYREEIRAAANRIKDKQLRDDTIAQLTEQLQAEEISEKQLRQQNRQDQLARQEEALDLSIQLAQANENTNAEIRAHRAKIRYLTERIKHTREGTNQRKRLRLAIAEERKSIRDLLDEQKDEGGKFNELAFSFLQELQGFSSNLATNVLPGNFQLQPATRTTQPPSSQLPPGRRPPTSTTARDERLPSPFEHGRGQGTSDPQAAAALSLREGGGAPATSGQLETLISIARNTNRLLGDIKRGVGHPEARTARELNRHRGGTVSVE